MEERSERITVRLSPSEEKWILKEKDRAGVSKSRYMRKVVLGELPQAKVPFREEDRRLEFENGISAVEMRKVIDHELPKWGNNLNQVARTLNQGGPVDDKIVKQLNDIREAITEIGRKILRGLG